MPNYEVVLRFSAIEAENPLEAARNITSICEEEAFNLIYMMERKTHSSVLLWMGCKRQTIALA